MSRSSVKGRMIMTFMLFVFCLSLYHSMCQYSVNTPQCEHNVSIHREGVTRRHNAYNIINYYNKSMLSCTPTRRVTYYCILDIVMHIVPRKYFFKLQIFLAIMKTCFQNVTKRAEVTELFYDLLIKHKETFRSVSLIEQFNR